MNRLLSAAKQFCHDETGTALTEYSLVIGIIAGAALLTILAISLWVSGRFTDLCFNLNSAFGGTCDAAAGAGS
ncbi:MULTISPECIES: Flp family type IVb pilin [unclassified Mesorhizobium]|uniref:Flp family type IVb pilin n=1 Tax=unclassified Mesorhizobium TaxID=325217 RepID=UPI000BAF32E8|nr:MULTISPECIES: Flp family type IVb pilin [unclassified Mesorhizobium]PBB84567.1 Flp family type IVb pilin [Mesorhizobium sp. WSM3876]TGS65555.1 Flp family type IVb pilin [Mesorhizobium sp. M3A.F.Ca.ET.201.01.1.1]